MKDINFHFFSCVTGELFSLPVPRYQSVSGTIALQSDKSRAQNDQRARFPVTCAIRI